MTLRSTRRPGPRDTHAALALVAPLLFAVSCGGPAGAGDAGAHPSPCTTMDVARCGTSCANDAQCGPGLYCLSSHCTADCTPGAAGGCSEGQTCAANGRCVASGDGGGNDVFIPTGDACPDIDVQLARRQATLMLLIDQSGSMTERFGNTTRWDAIRQTLVDPNTGVVRPLQNEIRFGLAMYTSHNGNSGGACPILRPPLMAVLNNYSAIAAAINAAHPDDDTPTAESVTAAAQLLMNVNPDEDPGARAIVLATDGEPDTCADPDAQSDPTRQAMARAGSVAAVHAAFMAGIRTYVVSVGSDVSQAHLQALADAGSGTSGAPYFRALDPTALSNAFQTITRGVRSCTFQLNGRVDAASAGRGDVRLDGMPLMYNDANGWRLTAPNQIELVGTACDRARTTGSTLSAHFPCDVITPG